jgi:Zn-dependent protease
MTIDWGSLAIVAVTTVAVTLAVVGVVTAGAIALSVAARGTTASARSWWPSIAGWAALVVAGVMVLFGLYLIIPVWP